ncbi:SURF1 family protein [Aureimonas sp. Leaf454]|uniref:SURF1 family protein n=1 Tax=Aureimonas sp. Leaf454 TaxID=1736381 RepID=UPI000AC58D7C|nr:SURF1 family protein [Aureimonas sp. Leaf454]
MSRVEGPGTVAPPREIRRLGRGSFAAGVVLCLLGIAVLVGLGTWQMERLGWKNGLIATIEARVHAPPRPLEEVEAEFARGGDVDYVPVLVSGRFLHADERHVLSTSGGAAGWNVFTPLRLDDGRTLFVNRGFVAYDRKSAETRSGGQVEGAVAFAGIARNALAEKPSSFVPDNDPVKNAFFWKHLPDLARGLPEADMAGLLPFIVDAGPDTPSGAGGPVGGTTVVDIPNSHLQYAITWYGLAAVLSVMLVLLVLRQRRAPRDG